jgi:hypothetical protein
MTTLVLAAARAICEASKSAPRFRQLLINAVTVQVDFWANFSCPVSQVVSRRIMEFGLWENQGNRKLSNPAIGVLLGCTIWTTHSGRSTKTEWSFRSRLYLEGEIRGCDLKPSSSHNIGTNSS